MLARGNGLRPRFEMSTNILHLLLDNLSLFYTNIHSSSVFLAESSKIIKSKSSWLSSPNTVSSEILCTPPQICLVDHLSTLSLLRWIPTGHRAGRDTREIHPVKGSFKAHLQASGQEGTPKSHQRVNFQATLTATALNTPILTHRLLH
jgi:hypothetical protein